MGEVIDEFTFRKRRDQYEEEGIKHFYFMSLAKSEFVDATKKGGLARFCNHSCNPNCYVEKWVVGDKLRMGIFSKRDIKQGEELVFDYNVDRYGAEPQACYCGEKHCIGYIGGKTQTGGNKPKLSHQTLSALGITDFDSWGTGIAKKRRQRKGDDDDEYISSSEPKPLDHTGVNDLMSTLVSCNEQWLVVRLLGRIHGSDDEYVQGRVLRLHGYTIMKNLLVKWANESKIVITILETITKWPCMTKNKINNSSVEKTVKDIHDSTEDEQIKSLAGQLLKEWSALALGYRIPRVLHKQGQNKDQEETPKDADKGRGKSITPPQQVNVKPFNPPKGPANPQQSWPRNIDKVRKPLAPSPPLRVNGRFDDIIGDHINDPLPPGWWWSVDHQGRRYFYTTSWDQVQWHHPTDEKWIRNEIDRVKKKQFEAQVQKIGEDFNKWIVEKRQEEYEAQVKANADHKAAQDEKKRQIEEARRLRRKEDATARLRERKLRERYKNMTPTIRRKLIAKTVCSIRTA